MLHIDRAPQSRLPTSAQSHCRDGTSGTLLACDQQGLPLADALPYSFAYPNFIDQLQTLSPQGGPASSASGSLARALHLVDQHKAPLLLRHQADWISGWLLENWSHGEEGNNLRLGWDLSKRAGQIASSANPGGMHFPRSLPVAQCLASFRRNAPKILTFQRIC